MICQIVVTPLKNLAQLHEHKAHSYLSHVYNTPLHHCTFALLLIYIKRPNVYAAVVVRVRQLEESVQQATQDPSKIRGKKEPSKVRGRKQTQTEGRKPLC